MDHKISKFQKYIPNINYLLPLIKKHARKFFPFLAITTITVVYWKALYFPFIQDDFEYLRKFQIDSSITQLLSIFDFRISFFYRPIALSYILLMYKIFGGNPFPYHVVALMIHLANTLLLSNIVTRLFKNELLGSVTAIIYAVAINIHLDTLSWIVGVNDLGGAFFFFLSWLLFLKGKPGLSTISFGLGLFCKEATIVLPILIASSIWMQNPEVSLKNLAHSYWKKLFPLIIPIILWGFIKLYGKTVINLDSSHPYALDFLGSHVLHNFYYYLVWMLQTFFPIWSSHEVIYKYILSGIVLIFIIELLFQKNQFMTIDSRKLVFIIFWCIVPLLPVIFLPNHAYRYYATYSLPPLIFILLSILGNFLSIFINHLYYQEITICVICIITISLLAFQANKIYNQGIYQKFMADGTNLLIRRAKYVNIIEHDLIQAIPVMPTDSIIVFYKIDLYSLNLTYGLHYLYNDGSLTLCDLYDLKFENGEIYKNNTRIDLYAPNFFAFKFSKGELIPLTPDRIISLLKSKKSN